MPKVASEEEQEAASETQYFIRLSYGPKLYKLGLTIELHFLVAGYGGLHLLFSGITQYLRVLVFVYERPIIVGVRILIVSSNGASFIFMRCVVLEILDSCTSEI